jgi:pentose-5-phosphate-3-epimerase
MPADPSKLRCFSVFQASKDPKATIEKVKASGMKVGVAVKPDTPAKAVLDLCPLLDHVLLMTVKNLSRLIKFFSGCFLFFRRERMHWKMDALSPSRCPLL